MNCELLKKRRKELGLKQEDVAKQLEINRATISKYENGQIEPPLKQLAQLAAILHLPLDDLVEGKTRDAIKQSMESGILNATEITHYLLGFHSTPDEIDLLSSYHKLNNVGKNEAIKRVEELAEIPKYQKQEPQEDK